MKGNGNGLDHHPISFDPINLEGVAVPPRKWLVENWIPYLTVTGLYGDGGVGKSLVAQQLLTACALGRPWLGMPTKRVRCIGVFCEDHIDELHRRQEDINRMYQCSFADLEDLKWIPRFGMDNVLMTFNGSRGSETNFYNEVLLEATAFGAELISIDTVADTFGGSENDRQQVRQYVQFGLGSLAIAISGCVLALAHPSRTGLASGDGDGGSTGWNNSFRSRAYLATPKNEKDEDIDPFLRTLSRKKANYATRNETIDLRWNDGTFARPGDPGIFGYIQRRTVERVFLDQLAAIRKEGRHVSDNPRAGNYAPTIFSQRPDREGNNAADFRKAMEALFVANKIAVANYKAPNRVTHQEIIQT